ncbi:MAG: T9SS type A sorting domain-containing protein [Candidatus Latescibacteria bacterium]|nr:T9SS type A sorting domain-containing protein [Candidatus Latescibacterota bacterium]
MKLRRLAFLVALSLVFTAGFFSSNTEAAIIDKVLVVSPDSGAIRGIDSLVVVSTTIRTATIDSNLNVFFWLVQFNASGDSSLVLGDTTGVGAATAVTDSIKTNIVGVSDGGAALTAINTRLTSQGTDKGLTLSNFIAARRALKGGRNSYTPAIGNGDSIVFTKKAPNSGSGPDSLTFTWYVRIPAQTGTFGSVRVRVAIFDPTEAGAAQISRGVSPASKLFKVDGDRPAQGGGTGLTLTSVSTLGLEGRTLPTLINFATAPTSRTGLAIGDSIVLNYDLGTKASAVILADTLKLATRIFGKKFVPTSPTSGSSATYKLGLTEGAFADMPASLSQSASDTTGIFLVDAAGNYSSVNGYDAVPTGVTASVSFLVDTKRPALDAQVIDGDTLLPVSGDTISDGTLHDDLTANLAYPDDGGGPRLDKLLTWRLPEALDSLIITFDGAIADARVAIGNTSHNFADAALARPSSGSDTTQTRILDFTALGDYTSLDSLKVAHIGGGGVAIRSYATGGPAKVVFTPTSDSLHTGLHTIKFQGKDLVGNAGSELSRTNVYIDVDDIMLSRLFPTDASGLDTIDEVTSQVVFKLSEPADSVVISYETVDGADTAPVRTRRLSGSSLTNLSEQTFVVDSLKTGTRYKLSVLARDLAGNFTRSTPDTFRYDTSFVVPVIAKFSIAVNTSSKGYGHPILAGDTLTVNLNALTSKSTSAVTYKGSAILKIRGNSGTGHGVKLVSGTGATDAGNGRIILNSDDWVTGSRSVIIKDTSTVDTLSISIVDSTNTASIYSGSLDSVVVVNPKIYDHIWVSAPDTVDEGEAFWVSLRLVDSYGNTRVADNRYVLATANKLGVDTQFEAGGIYLEKGVGGFWATSQSFTGNDLVFRVRDTLAKTVFSSTVGDNYIHGKSDSIVVLAAGASGSELAAPGEPVAMDYMGADGQGDQGGFILLSFAPSADHETLTAYRIWRENVVYHELDANGALVELAEPTSEFIPWAKVDAVPGIDGAMYVVVATLDGVATRWGVSAERGRETTAKQAFIASAQSIMQSRQAAKTGMKAPVFAALSPEALAFAKNGIAPRMKSTLPVVVQSAKVYTKEAVRAIDNKAPEAISALRVIDTPSDAGGSITVSWVKSASDGMLPRMISSAVGPTTTDMVAGVKGYNVYRKSGRGDYTLVGKTGAGETSFVDGTVFNGERYTYKVSAYDEDNVAPVSVERTAMAIRNRVFDRTGAVVLGLFGADNKVGFDDFFVLADRFGLTAGDEGFDSAFDLKTDNRIDFDDFFVFADNFGRGVEGSAKVVPALAGLNSDARLDLNAGSSLPRIGEELTVAVDLANFVEVKGYGFSVNYDPTVLEFVRVATDNNLLGSGQLAQPQVANKADGTVAVAAYGQTATQGNLGVSLVFRTKAEIENSYIDVTEGQLADGSYGLNQVASLGQVQVQTRPEIFGLADNYPNPFNPETTLKYQLPEAADVKLEVYNVVGQVVRTLVADHQNAGRYVVQWDATNDNGQPLSSGIYFYHIQAGEFQKTKKMLLLK